MSVGIAGQEGCALSRVQDLLAPFRHQHDFSFQDIYKLLCLGMPMPLAGPSTRGQFEKVDPDLLEPCRDRQAISKLVLTRRVERLWITRASRNGDACDIDLLHNDLALTQRVIRGVDKGALAPCLPKRSQPTYEAGLSKRRHGTLSDIWYQFARPRGDHECLLSSVEIQFRAGIIFSLP